MVYTYRIANSQLGQPEAMKVFCADLSKNTSITSLRFRIYVIKVLGTANLFCCAVYQIMELLGPA